MHRLKSILREKSKSKHDDNRCVALKKTGVTRGLWGLIAHTLETMAIYHIKKLHLTMKNSFNLTNAVKKSFLSLNLLVKIKFFPVFCC